MGQDQASAPRVSPWQLLFLPTPCNSLDAFLRGGKWPSHLSAVVLDAHPPSSVTPPTSLCIHSGLANDRGTRLAANIGHLTSALQATKYLLSPACLLLKSCCLQDGRGEEHNAVGKWADSFLLENGSPLCLGHKCKGVVASFWLARGSCLWLK